MRKMLAILFLLVIYSPLDAATIKGNLAYNDGTTPIGGTDVATVEVYDAAGNQLTKTAGGAYFVKMPTPASYVITIAAADIAGVNKTITLKFKLNGVVDRAAEGINTRTVNPLGLTLDIGFTKAPGTPAPRIVTGTVTGKWCTSNGVDPVLQASKPGVLITYADGTTAAGSLLFSAGKTSYTLTVKTPADADKTVKIEFKIGDVVDRTLTGVLGNDNRVQTIDVAAK